MQPIRQQDTSALRPPEVDATVRMQQAAAVVCISSRQLLAGATEVQIDHHGTMYRLRQTSLGKLILTK